MEICCGGRIGTDLWAPRPPPQMPLKSSRQRVKRGSGVARWLDFDPQLDSMYDDMPL